MDLIIQYFIKEKSVTEVVANVLSKPLLKYDDIKNEFIYWIKNRTYDCPNPVIVNGYTSASVAKMAPHLDAAGVYNFLVTLRDNPAKAQAYIDNGFPRK